MIPLLLGLPVVVFAFLEGTVFPFPVVLIFVLSWAAVSSGRSPVFTAFLSGVLIDLLTIRPLGTTALFFLGLTFVFSLYQRKYTATHLTFFLPAIVLAVVLYQLSFAKKIELWMAIMAFLFAIVIRFYVLQVFLRFSSSSQMRLEIYRDHILKMDKM